MWWDPLGDLPSVAVPGLLPGCTIKYDVKVTIQVFSILAGVLHFTYIHETGTHLDSMGNA